MLAMSAIVPKTKNGAGGNRCTALGFTIATTPTMKSVSVIAEPTVIITESQRRAPTRGGFTEINAVITRYRVNAATGTFPCGALFRTIAIVPPSNAMAIIA